MGASSSVPFMGGNLDAIVSAMMPVYYVHNAEVSVEQIELAKDCWSLIVEDKSAEFLLKKKEDSSFHYYSCISWFFSCFYERLFDVHPLCKPLFKGGLQTQGKFLVKMISITLGQLRSTVEFKNTMRALTIRHCERGVKAIEYGVMGDVLFHTIKKCVGDAVFTSTVFDAWTRIYSVMLQEIVPLAVHYEHKGLHQGAVHRPRYVIGSDKNTADSTLLGDTVTATR